MHKILLVADSSNWIFARHCKEIKKRLVEYEFDIVYTFDKNIDYSKIKYYDCVYILDIGMAFSLPEKRKNILGLRNEFIYGDNPNSFFHKKIRNCCSIFHVVNKRQYGLFEKYCDEYKIPILLCQHGVDTDIFKNDEIKNDSEFIVGISGNRGSKGYKGFEIIEKVCSEINVRFISANQSLNSSKQLTKEQMPSFYKKLSVYVCMSKSEGLNNSIMEAGAMSIPVISTKCGASEEIIVDNYNGFLINRDEESLKNKLLFIKNNRDKGLLFGENLKNTIVNNWSWNKKQEDFRKMFKLFFERYGNG